jgi:hypothetical protein
MTSIDKKSVNELFMLIGIVVVIYMGVILFNRICLLYRSNNNNNNNTVSTNKKTKSVKDKNKDNSNNTKKPTQKPTTKTTTKQPNVILILVSSNGLLQSTKNDNNNNNNNNNKNIKEPFEETPFLRIMTEYRSGDLKICKMKDCDKPLHAVLKPTKENIQKMRMMRSNAPLQILSDSDSDNLNSSMYCYDGNSDSDSDASNCDFFEDNPKDLQKFADQLKFLYDQMPPEMENFLLDETDEMGLSINRDNYQLQKRVYINKDDWFIVKVIGGRTVAKQSFAGLTSNFGLRSEAKISGNHQELIPHDDEDKIIDAYKKQNDESKLMTVTMPRARYIAYLLLLAKNIGARDIGIKFMLEPDGLNMFGKLVRVLRVDLRGLIRSLRMTDLNKPKNNNKKRENRIENKKDHKDNTVDDPYKCAVEVNYMAWTGLGSDEKDKYLNEWTKHVNDNIKFGSSYLEELDDKMNARNEGVDNNNKEIDF